MFTWLSKFMVIYGYSWLSLVIYSYFWLFLVILGYLWLSLVIYGYLYIVVHGYLWLSLVVFGYLLIVIPGYPWLSLVILGYLRLYTVRGCAFRVFTICDLPLPNQPYCADNRFLVKATITFELLLLHICSL